MAGVKIRIGTAYRWYSFLFNKRVYVHRSRIEKHEVEYNIDLVKTNINSKIKGDIFQPKLSIYISQDDEKLQILF